MKVSLVWFSLAFRRHNIYACFLNLSFTLSLQVCIPFLLLLLVSLHPSLEFLPIHFVFSFSFRLLFHSFSFTFFLSFLHLILHSFSSALSIVFLLRTFFSIPPFCSFLSLPSPFFWITHLHSFFSLDSTFSFFPPFLFLHKHLWMERKNLLSILAPTSLWCVLLYFWWWQLVLGGSIHDTLRIDQGCGSRTHKILNWIRNLLKSMVPESGAWISIRLPLFVRFNSLMMF